MKTLGIDLASDPKRTGVCIVSWQQNEAHVDSLAVGATDKQILDLRPTCDAVGIDCPFGWPQAFCHMVSGQDEHEIQEWSTARRDALRFRRTDHYVRRITGRWPLSVSSDLIAVAAMRCIGLLAAMGITDRSGPEGVFEVYPAAALHRWGLTSRGYKKKKGRQVRSQLVDELLTATPWMKISNEKRQTLQTSDDALDALICAFLAKSAATGAAEPPLHDDAESARTEGWIHMPRSQNLSDLIG